MNETFRIRLEYSISGMARFTGHLDKQRLWERALRRSGLPLSYSQGFSPKARLSLASALPLGYTSRCEALDFWMSEDLPNTQIQGALESSLPSDIRLLEVEYVAKDLPAMQAILLSSQYQIYFNKSISQESLQRKVDELLNREVIQRNRRGKVLNLRDQLEDIQTQCIDDQVILYLQMSARPGATGRPDELLEELGIDPNTCLIERIKLIY